MSRLVRCLSLSAWALAACEVLAPLDPVRVVPNDGGNPVDVDAGDAASVPTDVAHSATDAAPADLAVAQPDAAPLPDAAQADLATALPDAAPPVPDVGPMCRLDADCAPELCRGGVCVQRVQFTQAPPLIDAPDPVDVVSLDANADGLRDLAVLSRATSEVYILVGLGDGTFIPGHGPFAVGGSPTSLVIGHFDDDGLEDILVGNNGDGTLTILHELGDGDFAPDVPVDATSPPAAGGAVAIVAGIIDGDAFYDAVVADQASETLEFLPGTRPPADVAFLGSPQMVDVGMRPSSLALAELVPGDGPRVVGVDSVTGQVFVDLPQPGAFQRVSDWATAAGPISNISIADLDADGVQDLVATVTQSNRTVIRFADASEASLAASDGPDTSLAADVDGDGHLDVVVTNRLAGTLGVNCGDGARGFEAQLREFNTGAAPTRMVIDFFDGDTLPDVVTLDSGDPGLGVMLNRSPGVPP